METSTTFTYPFSVIDELPKRVELLDCPTNLIGYDKCLLIQFQDDLVEYAGLHRVHNSIHVMEGKIVSSDGSENVDSHVSFTDHDENTAYLSILYFPEKLYKLEVDLKSWTVKEHLVPNNVFDKPLEIQEDDDLVEDRAKKLTMPKNPKKLPPQGFK